MSNYITRIHVNKLLHLENLDILVCEEKKKHLIITGRNGSGKTVLLNAIAKLRFERGESVTLSCLDNSSLQLYFDDLSSAIGSDNGLYTSTHC